jgi:hypothetical protein
MSTFPSKNFSGLAKPGRFNASLFPAANILMLVTYDGLTCHLAIAAQFMS